MYRHKYWKLPHQTDEDAALQQCSIYVTKLAFFQIQNQCTSIDYMTHCNNMMVNID